jgi:hypothetical protein
MDTARFFTADACRAAGINSVTLKNWISRDPPAVLLTASDRASHVSGRPHLLTFRRVMQIAITAELVRLGWGPRAAAIAAASFTDSGNSRRPPGELYEDGITLLVARPGEDEPSFKVVNWKHGATPFEVLGIGQGATVVNLSAIVETVQGALFP